MWRVAHTCRAAWQDEMLGDGLVKVQHGVGSAERERTRILVAAMTNNVPRVRWLLARGARPGRAWRLAAEHNSLDALRVLAPMSASYDAAEALKMAALHRAVDVMRYVLEGLGWM